MTGPLDDSAEQLEAVKRWSQCQDGQRLLVQTPSILVGYRVEVYRQEGTTQWYTAVIHSYNEKTKVSVRSAGGLRVVLPDRYDR